MKERVYDKRSMISDLILQMRVPVLYTRIIKYNFIRVYVSNDFNLSIKITATAASVINVFNVNSVTFNRSSVSVLIY